MREFLIIKIYHFSWYFCFCCHLILKFLLCSALSRLYRLLFYMCVLLYSNFCIFALIFCNWFCICAIRRLASWFWKNDCTIALVWLFSCERTKIEHFLKYIFEILQLPLMLHIETKHRYIVSLLVIQNFLDPRPLLQNIFCYRIKEHFENE